MGAVVYSMNVSLDGYVTDAAGGIDFTTPSDEVHQAFNDQARDAAVMVHGRRTHEMMEPYWPDVAAAPQEHDAVGREFAEIYVARPRVVVSDSLHAVDLGPGVRLVRRADAHAEVARLRAEPGGHVEIGGPTLAGAVLDLIDEFRPMVVPVATGGGTPFWPPGAEGLALRLVGTREFADGTVLLRYARAISTNTPQPR